MSIETELPEIEHEEEIKVDKSKLPLLKVGKGDISTYDQMIRYGYTIVNKDYQYANRDCELWTGNGHWAVRHRKSGEIISVYTSY